MHYHTLRLNSVTEPRYGYLPLKSIPKRERSKCWQKGKLLVIRMLALCGKGELSVTQKAFSKTLLGHKDFFLREKWTRQRVRVCHLPLCVGLSIYCDLSLDSILFIQFICEITEGKTREEIWSSVNGLFFISHFLVYRKNQEVRQGIV